MKYKLNEQVVLSGSGALFNMQTGESFEVNDFGKLILEQMQNDQSLDEIRNFILTEYEVERETVEEHLEQFISYMIRQRLIDQY